MLLSRRGCVKVASRGCGQRLPLCFCPGEVASRLRPEAAVLLLSRLGHGFCLRTGFCLGTGALLPKVPGRPLANDRFLWRLRSGFDGVWLFRIHCPEAAVLPLSKLGCALVCVYVLELFFLSFKGLQSLSSGLGGVWPFRIHCPEAPVSRLSRLGCVTFFVYVLGLSSSPSRVPKVPLRQLVNDRFLPCLSSDLGGVWPFRTHCPEAPVLRLSRLGCVTFFVYVLGLSSSPLRVQRCFCPGEVASRLRPEAAVLLLSRLGHGFCLRTGFCLGTGALLPKVPGRPLANDRFLWRLRSGFDGVWLFRIHCPEAAVLPLSKLGCALVCVYVLELFFLSFKGFQSLSSDLAGVWPFRIHCPEAPVLRLSRLCCVTFFVYLLGLCSFPLRVPKVPLRQLVNDRFLPCLSSDLGGVWPFRIHCPEAPVLRLSRLGCVTFFVYVLGLSSSPLRVPKVPLHHHLLYFCINLAGSNECHQGLRCR